LVDANAYVKMGENYPEFGGNVNVKHSEFVLPKLLGIDKENETEDDSPLLLQAIQNNDTTISNLEEIIEEVEKKRGTEFRENLTGRIKLIIPRNTWLKSDEMNLELRGELDLVKTGPNFELFGDVTVNRGHYLLYGRKLVMQESKIIFQGGVDFDPTLDVVAEYTFRDSKKTKRILALTVNGLLSDPTINFTLDRNALSESEAVSILVFGKTPDEMDTSGQNGLVGSVGSNMVAQVLTSQLNKTLGSALNLDMVEITATENWQSAAFVVGKYITNDLFMTYQRGFGETEGDEITPETLTLEYELNRIFFLHLQSGNSKTSGLDVILKFEQKLEN
jgi:translocation and assembly module TamB